ncbi:hypothetical protein EX30DRAFT_395694 [Ascodesmis nigricans]|uniref:Uncharacterized protein n=1 Tax=Ascodesmis nigricans TaxID=341454 RepID=A0A4S2MX33_9PEZI|nr:hypothetical protein EX30DRAFT_395694 [Ascodesmis nigricans]
MRPDPRIRQNLDRISTSLESAAENVSTGCFTFTKTYLEPCVNSITSCCGPLFAPRLPHHRRRGSHRASRDFPFAFYDDEYYDYDSDDLDAVGARRSHGGGHHHHHGRGHGGGGGFFAWGTDELDRLLAGSGTGGRSQERMNYGGYGSSSAVMNDAAAVAAAPQRKHTVIDPRQPDPTVIPSTTWFGFLSKFGIRGKGMRYKPSAANLQEHPQRSGLDQRLEDEEFEGRYSPTEREPIMGRKRAGTETSRDSLGDESLRSRGDLWPSSEDEDDAVVIDDDAFPKSSDADSGVLNIDEELRDEEERIEREEEEEYKRRRKRARALAVQRGLTIDSMDTQEAGTTSPNGKHRSSAPPTILSASPEPYTHIIDKREPKPPAVSGRSHSTPRPQRKNTRKEKQPASRAASMTTSPKYRQPMSPRSPSVLSIGSVHSPLREEVPEFNPDPLPPPALEKNDSAPPSSQKTVEEPARETDVKGADA